MSYKDTCVALLSALAVGAAHAGATGTLTMSDFKVRLVDLDVSDGVTPGIDFYGGDVSIFEANAVPNNMPPNYVYTHSSSMFGAGSVSVTDGPRSSMASLVGDPFTDAATLTAKAVANGTNGYAQSILFFGYPNPNGTFDTVYFTLTPMTRLEITASARGAVDVDGGGFGVSQFWLDLGLPYPGPSTGSIGERIVAGLPGLPEHDSFDTVVDLAFENASADTTIGRFTGHINLYVGAPVPEPVPFALLGAGLAVTAAMRSRSSWIKRLLRG